MNVLFVHREPALASARVRVLQMVPHLEALGVRCRTALHPRSSWELSRLLSGAGDGEIAVIQKKTPSAAAGVAWRRSRGPIVFDFDDAILFRQRPRAGSHESPTRRRRFERACRLADAFVCGNEYLAGFCRPRGKPVLVAPSPVPLDVPRAKPGDFGGPVRLGWIGSPGNLESLQLLARPLRALARRRRVVLVVVSEASIRIEGVPTEHLPWTLASQERALATLDVGLMPLADSPWARGKCAYKLLQYMAAELPVVASPVGMNRELVRHEENGLLAGSSEEWVGSLERLLDRPELAARLGRGGRETVAAAFGYPTRAARLREFLAGLSPRGAGG